MKRAILAVFFLLAALLGTTALAQESSPPPAVDKAYWPTQGWRSSTPEAQGMDSEALAQAFDYVRQHQIPIHSLLIVRNGYVVLDAYFYPFQEGQVHDGASMTKSITSTLIGIAIGEHKLKSVRQPVLSAFPERNIGNRDPRKDRMTIEHLLTMTSGLDCHVEHAEITLRQMDQSKDWVQFMLDLPMVAEPGSKFEYCSGGMHLLSGVISQTTGNSALEFARRELFQPLGIEDVIWPSDPQGVSRGWGDLHLQPRDMAKIGYLWLNQGRWEGRQIIPTEWMQAATQAHSHPNFGSGEYGYGFWVYPQRDPFIYEALGRGGQRISVVPAKNLVVVFTGGEFEPGDIGKFIGESIKSDQRLPENAAGVARLAATVRAAAAPPTATPPPAAPATSISQTISGRNYMVEANPLGLKSLSLTFSGPAEAIARLEFVDGRVEQRPLGLDGVPRLSPSGRFGLPVALQGRWESSSTFVFDYDEVANINCYRFRLTFAGNDVSIDLSEKTGLVEAKFHGKSAVK
ncbi:MAG TPA: serine hydrolase [Terriglobales bacterium]|jgi:CubicO group peptidase (beta-lactamase class C family)|nr:serine hydrolase [Terriglobales bacterium]